jgi:hypothetical protein
MKLLIHTMVFSPDGVSTAYLYNDIAPTEGTTLPTFDENDAIELPFYYGAI